MNQNHQIASLNSRLISFGYDFVLLLLVLFVAGLFVDAFHIKQDGLVFYPIYFSLLYWMDKKNNGQSFGKKRLNIKVVDSKTFSKPTLAQLIGRNILRLLFIADALFIFGKNRQRLGDKLSGTLVINSN